ncbi:MAG: hypothetical protein CMM45_02245 [Rhodospirillaceae bacterium]|nr:hypothetical protein [Rhodospirillaceae bacterium]
MPIISADTPELSSTEMDVIRIMRQIRESSDGITLDNLENEALTPIVEPLRRFLGLLQRADQNRLELGLESCPSVTIFELQVLFSIAGLRVESKEVVQELLSSWLPRGASIIGLTLLHEIARKLNTAGLPAFSMADLQAQIINLTLSRLRSEGYTVLTKGPTKPCTKVLNTKTLH